MIFWSGSDPPRQANPALGAPGRQAGPPPRLLPGAFARFLRNPVRSSGLGPGPRAHWKGRGRGATLLLAFAPARPPPPPPGPLSFPQRCRIRLTRREGSQRSASEASRRAGNSAAPARRPAPGPGPASRRWRRLWWPGREGISLVIARHPQELTGAAPTHSLRLPPSRRLRAAVEPPLGAVGQPRGWGGRGWS